MTRDRFIQALACCSRVPGATINIRPKEAAELAELLRVGQTRVKTTQAEWTNEQYRQATEMLYAWDGDHLTERLGNCLAHLRQMQRDRRDTDKVLRSVGDALRGAARLL